MIENNNFRLRNAKKTCYEKIGGSGGHFRGQSEMNPKNESPPFGN